MVDKESWVEEFEERKPSELTKEEINKLNKLAEKMKKYVEDELLKKDNV